MSSIQNFTKESILKALNVIDNNSNLLKGRESQIYDLVHENRNYPPILALSEANKILGGQEITIRDFNNSTQIAFEYLRKLGFVVQKKHFDFSNEITQFLAQAKTTDLTTSKYTKNVLNLTVEVSFGKGNQARIPWIAFLGYGNTVSEGIYPVYLYYKERNLLILAYGVSETKPPKISWQDTSLTTIGEYFESKMYNKPERYKNSFVYKAYDTSGELNRAELNRDLQDLIFIYHEAFDGKTQIKITQNVLAKFNHSKSMINDFTQALENSNLQFDKKLVTRFVCSLITKPFLILTGLSGSGKTKIAQAFANWICEKDTQYAIIPIGADWTNREPLLGFPNALDGVTYIKPENSALDIIVAASRDLNTPYFLILDEMNLSHVERYFADFLSALESKSEISLHSAPEDLNGIPSKISFPDNLYIIGTVNIDETTYMFSPKVLDRANVIEFKVTKEELAHFLTNGQSPNLDILKAKGSDHAEYFVNLTKDKTIKPSSSKEILETLLLLFEELKRVGAEFGFRSAYEINRFIGILNIMEKEEWGLNEALDAAIMQKVLPKIHGSRRKLEAIIKSLVTICINNNLEIDEILNSKNIQNIDAANIKFPISLEKLIRMNNNLLNNGFTSFAEA